jgi:hypothetical protein
MALFLYPEDLLQVELFPLVTVPVPVTLADPPSVVAHHRRLLATLHLATVPHSLSSHYIIHYSTREVK